jgi:hypothetical protein
VLRPLFAAAILTVCSANAIAQTKAAPAACDAVNPGPASANLARAMRTPVHDIDASLPAQCVADWLMTTLGSKSFMWSLKDCTKAGKGEAPARSDTPECFVADGQTQSLVRLHVEIRLLSGKSSFHGANVSGCGRSKDAASLVELKTAVEYVEQGCRK